MKLPTWMDYQNRRLEKLGMIVVAAIAAFYAFICTPIYILISTNVVLLNSILPTVWDLLQILLQFFFYWCFAAFLIACLKGDKERMPRALIVVFVCSSFGRYFISLVIGYLMTEGLGEWGFFMNDLLYMMIDVLGDWFICGVAVLASYFLLFRNRIPHKDQERLLDFRDPACVVILCSIAFPTLLSIGSRIISDVFLGAPQNTYDLIWMILAYVGDLLSYPIGYLVVFLLLHRIERWRDHSPM
ncbi:MAG: hypothetical protein E7620_03180 [Ruminococcaceae bacterium]|nr:hypothetical protein [Oscillospiraceae bacterium]